MKDEDQFAALYAYSPYHNVEYGQSYPPVLLPTGANDPRVNPAHSRKFTARLQAAQGGDGVVLLRTSSDAGHGAGTPLDEVIEAGDVLVRFDDGQAERELRQCERDHALARSEFESLKQAQIPLERQDLELRLLSARTEYEAEAAFLDDSIELLAEDLSLAAEREGTQFTGQGEGQ